MKIFGKKKRSEKENFGSILRLVEDKKFKQVKGRYKKSCQVKDEATGKVLVECDVYERAIYSKLEMSDDTKQTWTIRPNRKIMPMRWFVYSSGGTKISEIRLPGFFRMMNPLSRKFLRITDLQANKKLKFIDLKSGIFDRLFGSPPLDWSITESNKVIAKVNYLVKKEDEEQEIPQKKGFFSKLRNWFKDSDWALQSYGPEPVMNSQTFLALALVYREVTSGPVE